MRKLRQYFLILMAASAILAGCTRQPAAETEENEEEAPAFYSPFRLI